MYSDIYITIIIIKKNIILTKQLLTKDPTSTKYTNITKRCSRPTVYNDVHVLSITLLNKKIIKCTTA